jgi:hypothetical protein
MMTKTEFLKIHLSVLRGTCKDMVEKYCSHTSLIAASSKIISLESKSSITCDGIGLVSPSEGVSLSIMSCDSH